MINSDCTYNSKLHNVGLWTVLTIVTFWKNANQYLLLKGESSENNTKDSFESTISFLDFHKIKHFCWIMDEK